jgi:hypothetical protein
MQFNILLNEPNKPAPPAAMQLVILLNEPNKPAEARAVPRQGSVSCPGFTVSGAGALTVDEGPLTLVRRAENGDTVQLWPSTPRSRTSLFWRGLVAADAHELAGALERNETLKTLGLGINNIGSDGARYVAAAL